MRTTVFRGLIAMVLVAGCSDVADKNGDAWRLGSDADIDASADAGTDGGRRDMGGPRDIGPDAGPRDMTVHRDAGTDANPDADLGPQLVTVSGWHSSAFEHSGFIEAQADLASPLPPGVCDPYVLAAPPAESWWVSGPGLPAPHAMVEGFGGISLMTLTGRLSERGEHGHLGSYDREFVVDSGERYPCQTAAALGHCVLPSRADVCVIPDINDPDATMRSTLTVTYPGAATTPVSYELHVIFNENVGDGRTDAVVQWQLDNTTNTSNVIRVDQLSSVGLRQERHGLFYSETVYEQLDGWIVYSEGNADGWYVSVSGKDPVGGPPLHVWGWFDVTETIALP